MPRYRLFIGNPGAGKSTIANCIAERVLFKSGISFISGKTQKLDQEKHDGIIYLDTPGLSDINMRQVAANSVTKALTQNGNYQIFFVITLSAGRLRTEDLTTIWLVLENARDIKCFSIIINKLSQEEHDNLKNEDNKLMLFAPLDLMLTHHNYEVFLLLNNRVLEGAEDTISDYPELVKFATGAPLQHVDPSRVNNIPGDDDSFQKLQDSVIRKIKKFSPNQLQKPVRL